MEKESTTKKLEALLKQRKDTLSLSFEKGFDTSIIDNMSEMGLLKKATYSLPLYDTIGLEIYKSINNKKAV